MTRTRIACLLLLFGALAWVGRLAIDVTGGDPDAGAGNGLLWLGAVLLTLGAALAAFDSVNHAPLWLQLIVGLCAPLALWMLLLAGNDMVTGSQAVAGGVFGGLVGLIALIAYRKSRPVTKHKGSHRD
jgi:hypothetical protein